MRLKVRMVSHFGRENDPLMILVVRMLILTHSHSANVPWLSLNLRRLGSSPSPKN